MTDLLAHRLDLLSRPANATLLAGSLQGVEKESLRVDASGMLAMTPHPVSLGAALTHPHITTDYSEALLEFVTGTHAEADDVIAELTAIHRFVAGELGDEVLWNQSMPARLPAEADIPIAWYGHSHSGMLKHVYRKGLALRYGKAMQCIAGIHYNYSLDPAVWPLLAEGRAASEPNALQSDGYIGMIRNFSRFSWLLMYLFGASPALAEDFLQGREHTLERLGEGTLYLPYATSLRMSDLGYQNEAQSRLYPCYTDLNAYLRNLYHAVNQPWPAYERIGTHRGGERVQLSTHILQIENEYYSSIRPKRVANRGERPLRALHERGVQYVEVRCLDIDPFVPVGIDATACRFLDAFLLMCALDSSPGLPQGGWCEESGANFAAVVKEGRRPGLVLRRGGEPVALVEWARKVIERVGLCAAALDAAHGGEQYAAAVRAQVRKIEDPALTPSARVLAGLRESGQPFDAYFLALSRQHAEALRAVPLPDVQHTAFVTASRQSIEEEAELVRSQAGSFDDYVKAYHASLYD